jgi:hypothetical protein
MESRLQEITRLIRSLERRLEVLFPSTRERSLALTKLEECHMWVERADFLNNFIEN